MSVGEAGFSQARIQLHLDVHSPIELVDLTLSFQALAFEYRKHLTNHVKDKGGKVNDADVKLFLTKIENNCILAELGGASVILGQLFTVMDYALIFDNFIQRLKASIDYFKAVGLAGTVNLKELRHSKAECGRFADLLDVVSKNKDGNLGIASLDYNENESEVRLSVKYSSEEAYQARKGALLAQKALEQTGEADYKSVLMYFHQTNIDDPKSSGRTGDKAVIKTISDKPLPVYFVSEVDQQKIAYTLQDPAVNPLKASIIVDVNVETDRNNIPRIYRVIDVLDIIPGEDD